MTEEITNKVLEKIKQEDIKPEAKWKFLIKNYTVWGLFVLSMILGSLAVASIIFGIKMSDWDVHQQFASGSVKFLIMSLSYFWLLTFVGFVVVAYFNFRNTKKGYRYNIYIVIGISLLTTLLLGGFAYTVGFGEKMEKIMTQKAPFYKGIEHKRHKMWNQVDKGLLGGKIIEINDNIIDLEDIKKTRWHVTVSTTQIMPIAVIKKGNMVRVIGRKTDQNCFEAKKIMPWRRPKNPPKFIKFQDLQKVKEKIQ